MSSGNHDVWRLPSYLGGNLIALIFGLLGFIRFVFHSPVASYALVNIEKPCASMRLTAGKVKRFIAQFFGFCLLKAKSY